MAKGNGTFRIGTGAGFSADRLDPAIDLARRGQLDVMVLECLGERTVAFAHRDRAADPRRGYNALLERRMRALLPVCREAGTVIITNMGAANPRAAAEHTRDIARALGIFGRKIACIEGDDVSGLVHLDQPLMDEAGSLADIGRPVVGMNAYLGADAIIPALEVGADVVIGGRLADPSMFLAPLMRHYGWQNSDLAALGAGTLVGHLMECGMQITGGYYADPGIKDVPDLAQCGYPIAEVAIDGSAVITKLPGTGGCVTEATVKEQLLYEVHDPAAYVTPDVTADFSHVTLKDLGQDRVRVSDAGGHERPEKLKVTVGFDAGVLAEAGVSYAGPAAGARGRLAAGIVDTRLKETHKIKSPFRVDLIGAGSLFATAGKTRNDSEDVRLHVALRTTNRDEAELVLWEVESLLCCGPAGGGGYRGVITPAVETKSVLIERGLVKPKIRGFCDVIARGRNERLLVRDIAHARAGDKGNTSNVNVWAYDPEDFELLKRSVTPERVKREFPKLVRGNVTRYIIDHLHGLNLVMGEALEGGVNASLNLDSHGKSWSYLILGMTLDTGKSDTGVER